MDERKKLKLGWVVSETIGMAIVNPRGLTGMKASPWITLTHKGTTVRIRDNSVIIDGSIEEAAMALAEHILKDIERASDFNANYFSYRSIEVYVIDGQIVINPKTQNIMEPGDWALLKKSTEKICNSLKAFM